MRPKRAAVQCRMRFDHLAREFRRRSEAIPAPLRAAAVDESVSVLLGSACAGRDNEREAVGRIVGALAGVFHEAQTDAAILDSLTPETICRLDNMLNSLHEIGCTDAMLECALEGR